MIPAALPPPTAVEEPTSPAKPSASRKFPVRTVLIAVVVLGAGGVWMRHTKHRPEGSAVAENRLPIVAVSRIERADLRQTVKLSAEFRPYQQVALHAKVAGYLQSIQVDVGDHVKEGQAIALLDVPELKNEVARAAAAVRVSEEEVLRAESNYTDVHRATQRVTDVAKQHPNLVAQQEVDNATARDLAASGTLAVARQKVEEAKAEEGKVRSMSAYIHITAPFDGVITRRYADPGALIQAGTASNTQAMPVVDLAEDKRLRLTFPVPESAVPFVQVGATVEFTIPALERTLTGQVARFSGKVDRATRTMLTEVDCENADFQFKPGMIAEVNLLLHERKDVVAVPVQAIEVGVKPSVLTVDANGLVQQRMVKLGLETPTKTEVLSGLQPGDLVLVGSRSGVQPGQTVQARTIELTAAH